MEKMSPVQRRLLSIDEVADYLGISVRTLYNRSGRRSKNPLPFKLKRVGKLLKVDILELERYVESL